MRSDWFIRNAVRAHTLVLYKTILAQRRGDLLVASTIMLK